MKSIIMIIPYFGKWPLWFDAFLISVAANKMVHWFCPTDCEIPLAHPPNISFYTTTLIDLNQHVNNITQANVPLTPRKFCDLKPAYGAIFKDAIKDYDFWGICDMDIIWGDIRKFVGDEMLRDYDIISSRKEAISGHFTLFRNSDAVNALFKTVPGHQDLFEQKPFMWFDEHVLTNHLKALTLQNNNPFNVYWEKILLNQERGRDSHQEYHLDRWQWREGKMMDTQTGEEVMYLHFINWKRTMKYCEVKYEDDPRQFYISFDGIHYKKHGAFQKYIRRFINVFDGYGAQQYRRIKKKKFKSLLKRIKRKSKSLFNNN